MNQEQQDYNDFTVTLKIPKKYHMTAQAVSYLLGYESFEEYVSDAVMTNVNMQLDGAGSLSVSYDNDGKTLKDKLLKEE